MVTVATASLREARGVAAILRQAAPGLEYRIFLLGREVAARVNGSAETCLPDFAAHHPGNCPADCLAH